MNYLPNLLRDITHCVSELLKVSRDLQESLGESLIAVT
jgi:hypothetical protein